MILASSSAWMGEWRERMPVLGLVRTIAPFFLLVRVNVRRNDWARYEVGRVEGGTVRDIPPEEVSPPTRSDQINFVMTALVLRPGAPGGEGKMPPQESQLRLGRSGTAHEPKVFKFQ